ncbi:hypothetical protein GN956_G20075 [Arapaima gigas]
MTRAAKKSGDDRAIVRTLRVASDKHGRSKDEHGIERASRRTKKTQAQDVVTPMTLPPNPFPGFWHSALSLKHSANIKDRIGNTATHLLMDIHEGLRPEGLAVLLGTERKAPW